MAQTMSSASRPRQCKPQQEMELTMEGSPITRCIKVVAPVGLVRSGIKRDRACSYNMELNY